MVYREIVNNLTDPSKILGPVEKTQILKHSVELTKTALRVKEGEGAQSI